ncbi:MAG TPA: FAD-binding oxidoreductase, partial [Candidatus Brachybacterium merdavium]|nr:FAD-binding oxidoreductase [Candidatus Brachybacterium merdavium]
VCARHGAPVQSRGGGTSLGGQCTNVAVVIDWSKYCNRLISVDPEAQTCVVEPGIVLDELNAQLEPYGLEFGPRPSTHSHCALGGMIGNNACGATAQRSGKTDENIVGLEILTHGGARWWAGPTSDEKLEAILAKGGPKPTSVAACARSPTATRTGSVLASPISRAVSPGTTSMPCCRSRPSTSDA